MPSLESIKQSTEALMSDVYALYLARGDPRIPWYAKAIIVLTVVYAFSPIDLIPDFIPYLGYLDDLIIIPAGIALAVNLMPKDVWEEYRKRARAGFADIKAVLDGARQILMERFSEDAALLGKLRDYLDAHGVVKSTVIEGKETEGA